MARYRVARPAPQAIIATVGFAVGVAALVLQFFVFVIPEVDAGGSLARSVIVYFSFFTILANVAAMLVYAAGMWARSLSFEVFRQPVTRAIVVTAMALVALYYHFVLATPWRPGGLPFVLDVTLHYFDPGFYALWWALFCTKRRLHYRDIPSMLVPAIIYLVYVMVRGEITGAYPYLVFDAARLGYGQVAVNVLGVLAVLTALSALTVAVERIVGRIRR